MQRSTITDDRLEQLLADAAAFFEAYLWDSEKSSAARDWLAKQGLREEVIRAFGVGYAPVDSDLMIRHLQELGYSLDELEAAGLARRSARGRVHAHFHSRIMFPVRDGREQVLGFAGLATHLGPSWPMWVTSPETGLYRRLQAVFGIDLAAKEIAATGVAVIRRDCIEVLRAYQEGQTNAVTVHSSSVTHEQLFTLAGGVRGGVDALDPDLRDGMRLEDPNDPEIEASGLSAVVGPTGEAAIPRVATRHVGLKRTGLVIATALLAVNAWTGAPLIAVWVGSQAQGGRVLSTRGVLTVLVVLSVIVFLIGWALTLLSAKYDQLSGRPRLAGLTSPWHRAKRGDRVQDIRSRYGISAPEKVVAACVIAGVLGFEAWFFLFAGSSLPHP
jgi:DNA primase catalytic core, N-terminal domain